MRLRDGVLLSWATSTVLPSSPCIYFRLLVMDEAPPLPQQQPISIVRAYSYLSYLFHHFIVDLGRTKWLSAVVLFKCGRQL